MEQDMRNIKRAAVAAALTLGLIGVAEAAMAETWYSQSSPLKAYEDDKVQGAAYGNFYNYNGSYARNSSTRKDYKAGGDGIFVNSNFYFYYQSNVDKSPQWNSVKNKQTDRTTSGNWVNDFDQQALRGDSEKARVQAKVCEDQSWSGDPCSTTVIRSFSY